MTGCRLEFPGAAGKDACSIMAKAKADLIAEVERSEATASDEDVSFADVEEYIQGADPAMPTLATRIGFNVSDFPPLDKLSDDQVVSILDELIPLLMSFGKTYAGPKDYPPRLTYPIVLEMTQSTHMTSMNGGWVSDGCTGSQVGCQWGMYCSCLQYTTREDFEKDGGEKGYLSERFYQGEGDPFGFPEVSEEDRAKRTAFEALSIEEKMKFLDDESEKRPPCEWHGEQCGTR